MPPHFVTEVENSSAEALLSVQVCVNSLLGGQVVPVRHNFVCIPYRSMQANTAGAVHCRRCRGRGIFYGVGDLYNTARTYSQVPSKVCTQP